MVARGAGDVGCAHCTVIGADRSCPVCTRLVCETCGADWTTCPEPTGREVRLGRTARLRDVDPAGRIGLVTRWVGPMKLFDVRRLRWVDVGLPRHRSIGRDRQIVERLTPSGELYGNHYVFTVADSQSAVVFKALRKRSLISNEQMDIEAEEPVQHAGMTRDGHYYFVTPTQLVYVVTPDGVARRFEPMPRRVIQACHVDVDRGLMTSATWSEILVHQIVEDKLLPHAQVKVHGNVSWVALEEPWLAACVEDTVRVWRVHENLAIGRETYQHEVGGGGCVASISRDGRYLALGVGREVIVHDLEQDVSMKFEDHTDDVCLVRFASTDHLLITADEDNRVILRPRAASGYVRSMIDIDVPEEPVELALDDELAPR